MSTRGRYELVDRFLRPLTLATTPSGYPFGWTLKKTAAAGIPTYLTNSNGMVITLAATNESEIVTMYQNDVLPFLLSNVRRVEFTAILAGVDANTRCVMGLGTAENDAPDSVSNYCWFNFNGANSTSLLTVNTSDGTNTLSNIVTGKAITTVNQKFVIDFSGGLANIRFAINGQPVATQQVFTMAAASATQSLQLFFQLGKGAGVAQPSLTIREVKIEGIYAD